MRSVLRKNLMKKIKHEKMKIALKKFFMREIEKKEKDIIKVSKVQRGLDDRKSDESASSSGEDDHETESPTKSSYVEEVKTKELMTNKIEETK